MIINAWGPEFVAKYGNTLPKSYLCFDTEFTGSCAQTDLIMEIGHTLVEEGKVVDQLSLILNWYGHPSVSSSWLDYKLNIMRAIIGDGWQLLPERIQKEGIDPLQALQFYSKLFQTWKNRKLPFVAQNGQNADERLLRGNFNRFINKGFELPPDNYFDIGGIYKATQIWESSNPNCSNYRMSMLPHRSDTLKSYFKRIIGVKVVGIKWSLPLIMEQYGLMAKHNVSPTQMHSAGFDSLCLHWIMEEFRAQMQSQQELKPKSVLAAKSSHYSSNTQSARVQRISTRRQRLL